MSTRRIPLFGGLLIAGLLWTAATLVAVGVVVGPAQHLACPAGPGQSTATGVRLGIVPFGPTCTFPVADRVGAPTGTIRVEGPDPVWGRALFAGSVTALVGVAGLIGSGGGLRRQATTTTAEATAVRGDSAVNPRR